MFEDFVNKLKVVNGRVRPSWAAPQKSAIQEPVWRVSLLRGPLLKQGSELGMNSSITSRLTFEQKKGPDQQAKHKETGSLEFAARPSDSFATRDVRILRKIQVFSGKSAGSLKEPAEYHRARHLLCRQDALEHFQHRKLKHSETTRT